MVLWGFCCVRNLWWSRTSKSDLDCFIPTCKHKPTTRCCRVMSSSPPSNAAKWHTHTHTDKYTYSCLQFFLLRSPTNLSIIQREIHVVFTMTSTAHTHRCLAQWCVTQTKYSNEMRPRTVGADVVARCVPLHHPHPSTYTSVFVKLKWYH